MENKNSRKFEKSKIPAFQKPQKNRNAIPKETAGIITNSPNPDFNPYRRNVFSPDAKAAHTGGSGSKASSVPLFTTSPNTGGRRARENERKKNAAPGDGRKAGSGRKKNAKAEDESGGKGKRGVGKRKRNKKRRPLWNQANYVVSQSLRIGCSKRGDRNSGYDTELSLYSNASASRMREFANPLMRFIAERHPEVSRMDEIGPEHVQEYIDEKGSGWSDATKEEYASRLRKLWRMSSRVFGVEMKPLAGLDFHKGSDGGEEAKRPRESGGMRREHWELLNAYMLASGSQAKWIPFITKSIGTRIEEVCSITLEDIDLEKGAVELRNCKNGRRRVVPIPASDMDVWKRIVEEAAAFGKATVCGGIKPSSAAKAIRRGMRAVGISKFYPKEANHAIRKLYARENYLAGIESGLGWRESWTLVQRNLGHGDRFRRSLFNTYVGNGLACDD